MGEDQQSHIPVLIDEVVELLEPKPGAVYVDATAGLGGHAARIAGLLGSGGMVVLNDLDGGNLARAADRVREVGGVEVVEIHGSFAELPRELENRGIRADCVLADLGFSSNQVEDSDRGLSFRTDGPLDMRLDPTSQLTVAAMINELSEAELADVIFQYGEERASRRIARAIVARRSERPFERTGDLADVVRRSAGPPPKGRRRIDRATRTFQALRIAVNGELEALDAFLHAVSQGARAAVEGRAGWLGLGSRVGVISFHSLEDRPVKRALAGIEASGHGRRLTRKPIVAHEEEQRANPRSRSAKLRGLEVVSKMG